jgi:AcrR family transcriptional regulator
VAEPIWSRPDRGARGPQPEHSRAEIAAAAIGLADAGGLAAATMRAVAGALSTTAGALYRYLASRDDLLDLMVDAVLAELPLDRELTGDWLGDLVTLARDQLALFRRHPWLVEAIQHGRAPGPCTMDYFERCLRIMAPVPAGAAAKMEAIAMVTGVVSLFARSAGAAGLSPEAFVAAVSPARHPHLVAAFSGPGATTSRPDPFDRTVRGVLRGLLSPDVG